jgi:hypothetical protein
MNELVKAEQIDQSTALISVIEKAAYNPDVDIDKMERLLAMQERIIDRQAEQAFNEAMVRAQAEMPTIEADSDNPQTKSKYAKFEKINQAIKPIYTKEGFSLSFGTADSSIPNYIRVMCDVSHVGGHHKAFYIDLPPDVEGIKGNVNKTPVHGIASAHSYSKRYLEIMIFNVTIGGEDDDGNAAGGDTRSALDVAKEHLDYMALVREWWPSIAAIKEAIATKEYSSGVEAVSEMPDEVRQGIWKAPTKGGIFTTDDRAVMKSNEWHAARESYYGR